MSFSFDGIYRSTSYALEKQATAMALLQEQVSTGSQINRASDNPSDANRVMALNSNNSKLEYFIGEIDDFSGRLDVVSDLFSMMSGQLTKFEADLTAALSMGDYNKAALALGIDDLLESLVSLANTEHKGQRFFGGADSASTPYIVERSGSSITKVTYNGSYEDRKIEVAPNVEISSVFIGDKMFRENSRQSVEFITNATGAAVGTGTSSIEGYFDLDVTTSGPNYVLSIDGGLSTVTVPIGGDANTAVTDSRTGKVLFVDTTGLTDTGTVTANVPGTHDVFNLLISIRDLLGSPTDVKEELSAVASSLYTVHKKVVSGFSIIGGRSSTLGIMRDGYENIQFSSKEEISRLQDADIAQIAVDLTRRETLYQMSMAIAGKLLSTSLMDFL
ncbi:MAG: flagellar hook-associated protein 3 [Planctomycetes bacterium]|nr:flagellar hook-associated protein 3 [Planctomycetota bacterium]